MDTIAICAVFQNAASRILEWIAFHRVIGVDRFVLYDLGSTDGTAALIARSRFCHQVTVIDWTRGDGRVTAHPDFVAHHARHFDWTALIEVDEFIHPLAENKIRSLLPRYEAFSMVMLRRLTFSTAGPSRRPGQLVLSTYTNRTLDESPLSNAPALLRTTRSEAEGGGPPGGGQCNARGEAVRADGPADQLCDDTMVVNRYPSVVPPQDRRDMAARILASLGLESPAFPHPKPPPVDPTIPDRRILRLVPRVRATLHDAPMTVQPPATAQQPPAVTPVPRERAAVAQAPAGLAAPASTPTAIRAPVAPAIIPAPVAPAPRPPPAAAAPGASPLLLGIGIITYNRRPILSQTLDRVRQHTKYQRTVLAVADDGSTDDTLDMLRARQVLTVTGRNMSIAWNKNRALFLLCELLRCDVVVLLEDDAFPVQDGWEGDWIRAAVRWGHANVAGRWLADHFVSGAGTPDDPILSKRVTAQCAVFSHEAISFGGYFDPRFRGYGHEHVEHSRRLIRMGYGGVDQHDALFNLLWGGLDFHSVPSSFDGKVQQVEQNRQLAHELFSDFSYRAPWRNEAEARQFRDEMRGRFRGATLRR